MRRPTGRAAHVSDLAWSVCTSVWGPQGSDVVVKLIKNVAVEGPIVANVKVRSTNPLTGIASGANCELTVLLRDL